MEKADNVVVLRGEFYWNDVGNWESVREVYPGDEAGNVVVGENHVFVDSSRNTVFAPNKTVGVIGLDDIVVVDGGDAILVCKRERTQDVRAIVDKLKKKRQEELI
jgi:mannose-1-phosphate guanylyltransferase